jgi:hypothetical protein
MTRRDLNLQSVDLFKCLPVHDCNPQDEAGKCERLQRREKEDLEIRRQPMHEAAEDFVSPLG